VFRVPCSVFRVPCSVQSIQQCVCKSLFKVGIVRLFLNNISLVSITFLLLLSGCSGSSGNIPATALLQSISVTPANQSTPTGGAVQFTAIATYGGGTKVDISSTAIWSSTSTTIATVNASGLASGLSAGTTTITATSGTISGSNSLTVTTAVLNSIVVTPANPNIAPGLTQQLTATGTYSDGTTANITTLVTWTSNTPSIATVNGAGLATGVTSGTSIFTASMGIVSGSTIPALSNEVEANNAPATANALTPTVTLTGQLLSNLDLDYYKVTAAGPGAISVAVAATSNFSNVGGWSISILDSTSTVLASANCNTCSNNINAGITTAGTYYVLVQAPSGTSSANNSTQNYTLNLSLSNKTNTVEVEPNNTPATANTLTSAITMTGQLLSNADLDYYKVTATGPGAISVAVAATSSFSNVGGWSISILDSTSTVLASANCNTCSNNINAGITTAGTYYVLVQAPSGTSSANNSTQNYTINVTTP